MKKLLATALLLLALVGCTGHIYGQVTAKTHKADYSQYVPVPYPCGKSTCIRQEYRYYPACYGIQIDHEDSYCIPQKEWEGLEVGDFYDNEKDKG